MANLLTPPKAQFFDSNGDPLTGGLVYTYVAGTSTPQASYTDYGGLTANTNPVVLDSRGEANIWLSGNYKIVLTQAASPAPATPSNIIYTVDNVQDIQGAISGVYGTILNLWAGTSSGTANALTLSPSPAITSYAVGQTIRFLVFQSNTGAATLQVNALSAISIKKFNGSQLVNLVAGDLTVNTIAEVEYDGTQFQLLNSRTNAQGADVASAATINLDATTGDIVTITGTTNISTMTLGVGQERTLIFAGILNVVNSATLITGTGANIVTASGTVLQVRGDPNGTATRVVSSNIVTPRFVLQRVSTVSNAFTSTTSVVPVDDTIPQSGEGTQLLSVAITPTATTTKLVIEVNVPISISASANLTVALFQDAGANALKARAWTGVANGLGEVIFVHEMTSGSLAATTFAVRYGPQSGTAYVNGTAGARYYGGAMAASIVVTEYAS